MINARVHLLFISGIFSFGGGNAKMPEGHLIGPNLCPLTGSDVNVLQDNVTATVEKIHDIKSARKSFSIKVLAKEKPKYQCCKGYRETEERTCKPHCENTCVHGTCHKPNTCQCNPGYRGPTCEEASCAYINALSGVPQCEWIILGFVIVPSSLLICGPLLIYRSKSKRRKYKKSATNKCFEQEKHQWDNPFYFTLNVQQSLETTSHQGEKTSNQTESKLEVNTSADKNNIAKEKHQWDNPSYFSQNSQKSPATTSHPDEKTNIRTENKLEMKTRADKNIFSKENHRASKSDSLYLKPLIGISKKNNVFDCYEEVLPQPFYANTSEQTTLDGDTDLFKEHIYTKLDMEHYE